ncbi:MAG: hypothetical protein WCT04_17825 [Planctomycetota bacterium]
MPIRFRPRFSLLTLLLTSLLCGSGALLWMHREPWQVRMTIREKDVLEYAAYADGDAYIYTVSHALRKNMDDPMRPVIHIYDPNTGRLFTTIPCREVNSFGFGPWITEKSYIVTSYIYIPDPSKDVGCQIWLIDTGVEIIVPEMKSSDFHLFPVPSGATNALIYSDGKYRIVSLPGFKRNRELPDLPSAKEYILSPDGKWAGVLLEESDESFVRLIPTITDAKVKLIAIAKHVESEEPLGRYDQVCFSPNSKWIATNVFGQIRTILFDIEAEQSVGNYEGSFCTFSNDNTMIMTAENHISPTGSNQTTFRVWKIGTTSQPLCLVETSGANELKIANRSVMCNSPFHIWNLETGVTILADSKASANFSDNGKFAYVWSQERRFLCATNGTILHTFEPVTEGQFGINFAKTQPGCVSYLAPVDETPPLDHCNEFHIWSQRRPEFCYGYAWLWEFWLFVVIAGAWVWSVVQPVTRGQPAPTHS